MSKNEFQINRTAFAHVVHAGHASAVASTQTEAYIPAGAIVTGMKIFSYGAPVLATGASVVVAPVVLKKLTLPLWPAVNVRAEFVDVLNRFPYRNPDTVISLPTVAAPVAVRVVLLTSPADGLSSLLISLSPHQICLLLL